MNFLAHAYLSFGNPTLLIGNMIADSVRGKQRYSFDQAIRNGIQLHHAIDEFTDAHEATMRAKDRLRPACGRYCGVFMDIVYDHFLANDLHYFDRQSLALFAQQTYHTLDEFIQVLPEHFKRIFYYMQLQDWLYSYRSREGIARSFKGIYHRAKFLQESDLAFKAFEKNYDDLKTDYTEFIPDLVDFSENYKKQITNNK